MSGTSLYVDDAGYVGALSEGRTCLYLNVGSCPSRERRNVAPFDTYIGNARVCNVLCRFHEFGLYLVTTCSVSLTFISKLGL